MYGCGMYTYTVYISSFLLWPTYFSYTEENDSPHKHSIQVLYIIMILSQNFLDEIYTLLQVYNHVIRTFQTNVLYDIGLVDYYWAG